MHDIRAIRADPAGFDAALARRGMEPASGQILELDQAVRSATKEFEESRAELKLKSREVGKLKAGGKHDEAEQLIRDIADWEVRQSQWFGNRANEPEAQRDLILSTLPNTLDPDVPDGRDESANVVLHQHGDIPDFAFTPKQHFELGEALGLMDFATAAKIAGARFTVLKGPLARMERALGQWMLALHTDEHGYTEASVPLLVNDASMYGTGQLPKFADDLFRTTDDRSLIPTAEVPLTNFAREEIFPEADLPLRLTALTPCFRSEAGSAGRDTRGMLRQHQFAKVEMVSITTPDASAAEHERMTRCAERVLTDLGLTWRRVFLCAGDTGFGAARTYDLEVWLPGQGAWREISSCSNTRDFQARRMNGRFKPREGKGNQFLHTLNGSGVAVGRALIAVMETFQQEDGSVLVPEVLRPWMGGIERIAR
ncbi:serine--tRNA ligase [Roseomonas sp. CECT 9278]|uniref:serine--tRNA ligase n=1 Tax=Roseomonas sp. CECT 9278 TaxID=2845823 RepID=UPI001E3B5984|nr:serine--tRNA ligase [Roseomonas sp. CECT 9278]CAH0158656.1 Serine--tRNA ligase [Roseomonas sp. CECT 9278]